MLNTMEVIDKGMKCLSEQLGIIEAEQFISVIIRERFDYTKWQREHFDAINDEKIVKDALALDQIQPFEGLKAMRL